MDASEMGSRNRFLYLPAGPLVAMLIRRDVLSLRLLSFLGTLSIGLGQIACFLVPDVFIFVPTLGLLCGEHFLFFKLQKNIEGGSGILD